MTSEAGTIPELRVGVRELRGNLTRHLRAAGAGMSVLVTLHDAVTAEIRPPPAELRPPRQPGRLRGQIRVADDIDILPDHIIAAMEE